MIFGTSITGEAAALRTLLLGEALDAAELTTRLIKPNTTRAGSVGRTVVTADFAYGSRAALRNTIDHLNIARRAVTTPTGDIVSGAETLVRQLDTGLILANHLNTSKHLMLEHFRNNVRSIGDAIERARAAAERLAL